MARAAQHTADTRMVKLLVVGIASLIAGIAIVSLLVRPTIQKRVDDQAKKDAVTISNYNKSRIEKMRKATDDKTILETLKSHGDDQLELTNVAKSKANHKELETFAQGAAYTTAYNRELATILLEQLGYKPATHGTGPHCDSVGC